MWHGARVLVFAALGLLAGPSLAHKKFNITIGYLPALTGDLRDRQGLTASGALSLALEELNNGIDLLPDVEIQLQWNDTKYDMVTSTRLITEMSRAGVVAFFGPEGRCETEAIIAQSRNLPMISYKCSDYQVSRLPNFARLEPPGVQATKALISLLRYYRWNKFSILYEESWMTVALTLANYGKDFNMTVNHQSPVINTFKCCVEKMACCAPGFWYQFIHDTKNKTRMCNFIVHERCVGQVVTPCCGVAPSLIKNPVAHCWSEQTHHKRKFCTVCRKRLDELPALHCMICEYYVHAECVDFAAADCKENATYCAGSEPRHVHHWREGNLPANSKCAACRRACCSTECLTGYRCEWCGTTCHAGCRALILEECNFGMLQPIFLPPSAVSIPRTEVPMEAIIGVHVRPPPSQRDFGCPRSVSEEFSSGCEGRSGSGGGSTGAPADQEHRPDHKQHRDRTPDDRDEEVVKVYDGEAAWSRRLYRPVVVGRNWNERELVSAALRAFHVARNPDQFELTDALAGDEPPLKDPTPLAHVTRLPNKRPALFLRFKESEFGGGEVRVYPGRIAGAGETFVTVPCCGDDTVSDLMAAALERFGLNPCTASDYRCSEILLDRGGENCNLSERVLEEEERPWRIVVRLARESVRRMELARFYLQPRRDPHGPTLALFVASLPPGLSERNYENILVEFLGTENKFTSIGPIYYEYGSMVITYEDASKAVRALYALREAKYEDKHLLVMLLPSIEPTMVPEGVKPLLVFVNVKSGGCQGLELISSFRKLLNPYQVFDLENGGPLPGLYVFRHIPNYKILVCGGDGTIGWVLQCLDNVGQDSQCSNPPCAIVPLGTGNDLARVLRWGSGYTGCEDPLSLLRDVIDAEEIRLDRWTVVFHPEDKQDEPKELSKQLPASVTTGSQSEDNSQILVMNNYFGIGIDADLCLDFHNAREENPNKFNSRLRNKGVYVKMGLRKMVGRKMCKDLHKAVKLEVDGRPVELPAVEGIIILNILSWGSGANPWGPEKDDQFNKPNHWDGMLEVVGVTGVVHLGQIQSGLRGAMRIAQGGHIKINLKSEIPVQVDGEPWVAAPSEVVVLKSALKATMLKKTKRGSGGAGSAAP